MECMVRVGALLFRKETNNGSVTKALTRFMTEVGKSTLSDLFVSCLPALSLFLERHLETTYLHPWTFHYSFGGMPPHYHMLFLAGAPGSRRLKFSHGHSCEALHQAHLLKHLIPCWVVDVGLGKGRHDSQMYNITVAVSRVLLASCSYHGSYNEGRWIHLTEGALCMRPDLTSRLRLVYQNVGHSSTKP